MKNLVNKLDRLNLNTKLLLTMGGGLLIALLLGLSSLAAIHTLSKSAKRTYELDLLGVSHILEAQTELTRMGRDLRWMAMSMTASERAAAKKSVIDAESAVKLHLEAGRKLIFRDEVKKALRVFDDVFPAYAKNVQHVIELLEQGDAFADGEATQFLAGAEYDKTIVAADKALAAIAKSKQDGARLTAQQAAALASRARLVAIGLLVFALAASVGFGLMISASIRRPMSRLCASIEDVAAGRFHSAVPFLDYSNEVGALARAVSVLQAEAQQMETQRWIKTNLVSVSAELQAATSLTELTERFLSSVAPLLKVGHAALYLFEEEQHRLRLLGGYALRKRNNLDTWCPVGHGLVGQVALERAPIIFTNPPADYISIKSGLGEAVPKTIVVLPMLLNERLVAVLELATFEVFGVNEQALLDGLLPILALSIEIIERNTRTRQLLEETRLQAENMEKQAAKLEEQAVEMEAQQHEIKATEAWFRSIVESAPDGLLVVDEHGSIILTNPQVEAMFGYGSGELLGGPIEILVPQALRDRHLALRDTYLTDEHAQDMAAANRELRGVRKDGTEFTVEVGLARLPAIGGRGRCVSASVRGSSDRNVAEV